MRLGTVIIAATMLAGCSASENPQKAASGSSPAESAAALAPGERRATGPASDPKSATGAEPLKISLPQLAYSYALGFVLASDKIAAAQDAHRTLCEQLGASRCQLLALQRDGGTDRSGDATLKLRVATADAKMFSDSLTRVVTQAGGRAEAANVVGEDVSKQMVDTSARIRQRELLVARLTEILRTRNGSVAQLVEAERSVAQAQEELDQAKAWLAELQGRVAMSDFEIRYTAVAPSASPGSTASLLGEAVTGSGATFLIGLRGLLTILIYLLPWVVVAGGVALLVGRFRNALRATDQA
jgi:hypothetical protein